MKYETARRLKDSGFPQNHHGSGIWMDDETHSFSPGIFLSAGSDMDMSRCSYVPSLHELIDGLGDGFKFVERTENQPFAWTALSPDGKRSFGDACDEAVASLWIEVNGN